MSEQPMGTEQNLVLFLTGCSGKKPYFKGGFEEKWNEITTISI